MKLKPARDYIVSCNAGGLSVIENGALLGKTLRDYVKENPAALGTRAKRYGSFPLLIKAVNDNGDKQYVISSQAGTGVQRSFIYNSEYTYSKETAAAGELFAVEKNGNIIRHMAHDK